MPHFFVPHLEHGIYPWPKREAVPSVGIADAVLQ